MISLVDLRRRLGDALAAEAERVRALRQHEHPDRKALARARDNAHVLGLLLGGATGPAAAMVLDAAVGYGSRLVLEDVDTGERSTHRLMRGEAMDLDAGHVTTDSPLGDALLGCVVGDVVSIRAPRGERRVRIEEIETLGEFLEEIESSLPTPVLRPRTSSGRRAEGELLTGTDR